MSIEIILAVFGAGILSAVLGALPIFIMTGFIVVAGLSGGSLAGVSGWNITDTIGFGIFLGPHITFGGGVAAAIYAKKRGHMETGDITIPLIKFNDVNVLFVGGIFGVLGYVINYLLILAKVPTDTIALTVVLTAMIARLLFSDKGLTPSLKSGNTNYFPVGDSLKISIFIGLAVGAVSAYYAINTGDVVLGWALSAVGLIFVQMGSGGYAFHHTAIVSAIAGTTTGNIYLGILFGIVASLLADVLGALFNREADSHIDPPALSIFILTTVIILLF